MSTHATQLRQRIAARAARVAVIGLGYVGLPTAVLFARRGFPVVGIDIDREKVERVRRGTSYVAEVSDADLRALGAAGGGDGPRLAATADYDALGTADAIQICVPTPCTRNKEPDVGHIRAAAEGIAAHGRPGQLVILRSTSYPGTTRELVKPILESAGRTVGEDVFLAFVPERIDPGRKDPPAHRVPVVVGGVDPAGAALAADLFAQVVERVVPVSTADAAEMTKLLENVFRNVNIALVNQLALLCDRMGLDVWEIVDAAATKPYGFMRFTPGPGVGGHCIPVDPYYLSWKAREYDFHMDFIELAARVNDEMPYFAANKILSAVRHPARGLRRDGPPRVLVLGVTFKKDVADERHSPAVKVIELLRRNGVEVAYHDALIPSLRVDGDMLSSRSLVAETLAEHDAVVIATDHSGIDYGWVVAHARLVVDLRNATAAVTQGREKIIRL
ncbi:MAG TPA: nucleotide sugar dehydrogenase [bacterium]|nr:nucleotide sugar dehydrogenase [bacterium]